MFLEYGAQSSSCKHIRVADFGVSCRHRLPTPFFQDGVELLFCIVLRYNMKMQLYAVIANPVSGFRIKISRVEMKESSKWEDQGLYA
jgi:hypothetical protein